MYVCEREAEKKRCGGQKWGSVQWDASNVDRQLGEDGGVRGGASGREVKDEN